MEMKNKENLIKILCDDKKLAKTKEIQINYENGYCVLIGEDPEVVLICQDDFYLTETTLEKIITDLCFEEGLILYGEHSKFENYIIS